MSEKRFPGDFFSRSPKKEKNHTSSRAIGITIASIVLLLSVGGQGGLLLAQSALAASQTTLTVRALDSSGTALSMWVTISDKTGQTLGTGNTPLTIAGTSGQTYTVTVSNYGTIVFDHWANGQTDNPRNVTLGKSVRVMTAYYKTGSTTSTGSALTVNAVGLNGSTLNMWTTITQGGAVVQTGFTPLTFNGTLGQTYTVTVSNYQNYVFDHWAGGSTSNTGDVTIGSLPATMTAYYQTGSSVSPPPAVGSITDGLSPSSVTVGQRVAVSGMVYDNTSDPMPNVNLAISMGSYSMTTASNSGGAYSVSMPTSAVGSFMVNVKASGTSVSATPLSLHVSMGPPPTPGKTGVYIPMYSYPDTATVNSFLSIMKTDGPSLPYVVSINPNSGPGTSLDTTFTSAITTLHSSGLNITVIGYVPTGYGTSRTVANVEGMIDKWYSLYPGIDGIMFDEVDNTPSTDSFYQTITDYARAHGAHFLRGNPGAPIDAGKLGMFDTIDVGELGSFVSESTLQAATFNGADGKAKFGFIVHSQSTLNTAWMVMAEKYLGAVYITDATEPNPYAQVPSYFVQELAVLQAQ